MISKQDLEDVLYFSNPSNHKDLNKTCFWKVKIAAYLQHHEKKGPAFRCMSLVSHRALNSGFVCLLTKLLSIFRCSMDTIGLINGTGVSNNLRCYRDV